ncbi:HutD/Ves family protein [Rhizobium paknamense]|uniref:Environmental stress-induced protein Ves n=1 Tax=Rhizobium paknamense TaxID=1206817 RepID=A0ABU0IDP4_9HYPH|nr:HutD family protein [Rhizobium paknamense]MDQ0456364.1 environmental stress-induced protein Ves [Rhizobium paknamense]
MRVLRAEAYQTVPWKNGGGVTREVALHRDDAVHSEFLWRVSIATVAQDGPFSRFDGIDRSIAMLSGAGMRLEGEEGAAPVLLLPESAPYAFPGEAAIHAVLVDGVTTDLNLMTRRAFFRHDMQRFPVEGSASFRVDCDEMLLLATSPVTIHHAGERVVAGALDCIADLTPGEAVCLTADKPAEIFILRLWQRS